MVLCSFDVGQLITPLLGDALSVLFGRVDINHKVIVVDVLRPVVGSLYQLPALAVEVLTYECHLIGIAHCVLLMVDWSALCLPWMKYLKLSLHEPYNLQFIYTYSHRLHEFSSWWLEALRTASESFSLFWSLTPWQKLSTPQLLLIHNLNSYIRLNLCTTVYPLEYLIHRH